MLILELKGNVITLIAGPFTISTTINEKEVFWLVNGNNCVVGTTSAAQASLFYIVNTNDPSHPTEFFISYQSANQKQEAASSVMPSARQSNTEMSLPLYLSTDGNIFGENEGPLQLKHTLLTKQATFSLQSRTQSMFSFVVCSAEIVSVNEWLEGERFFIKCSRHAFKRDGYIAMCMFRS